MNGLTDNIGRNVNVECRCSGNLRLWIHRNRNGGFRYILGAIFDVF